MHSGTVTPQLKSLKPKVPELASASVSDALAALQVNPDTGLTHAEVDNHAGINFVVIGRCGNRLLARTKIGENARPCRHFCTGGQLLGLND
jgi:hypothetical protein